MKTSQIDRAIAKLESEMQVLELAIAKLKEQQATPSTRKRRTAKTVDIAARTA